MTLAQRRGLRLARPRRPRGGWTWLGVIAFAQRAVGTSAIAFGGLSWALDGGGARRWRRCCASSRPWPSAARWRRVARERRSCTAARDPLPGRDLRLSGRRAAGARRASTSRSPPARRSRSWARTARARPRWRSSCAGCTTRRQGAIEVDGADLRDLDVDAWRSRVTAVFQDFIRFELPLRDNVAPGGAPDDVVKAALRDGRAPRPRGARHAARRAATTAARTSPAGSGSAWRWRARCARCGMGAGLVLLDEPTAQLDVRGEAEIFEPHPGRHAPGHHDPDLAPLLDRPPGRPHLRAGARPRDRARHARRADGAGRPLSHDVRAAGAGASAPPTDEEGAAYERLA